MIYKETDKYRIAKFGGKVYWCNHDVNKFGILHTTKSTIEEIEKELGDNPAESNVEEHKKYIFRKINEVESSEIKKKIGKELRSSVDMLKHEIYDIRGILETYENNSVSECDNYIDNDLRRMVLHLFDIEHNLEKII